MTEKLSVEVSRLIEENQALVHHLVSRIIRRLPTRHDYDDLVGYGLIGLVEATRKYEPKRGIEFVTFAYPRVHGAIYDGISKLSWMSRSRFSRLTAVRDKAEAAGDEFAAKAAELELAEVSHLDSGTEQQLVAEDVEDVDSGLTRLEEKQVLAQLINELPDREKRLVSMVYIDGVTLNTASQRLGISKSWASRMHAKTLEHLTNEARNHMSVQ